MTTLGIIAGGGELPRAIAESSTADGRPVYVIALRGSAGPWVENFAHSWVGLGETTKAFRSLRSAECRQVVLAGQVERPKFSEIKLDARSVLLAPRVIAAARRGDDALLRALVELFEREGFEAVGAAKAAPGLLVERGPIGRLLPTPDQRSDIDLGFKVVEAMGSVDVGQAAIVCAGLTLAIEAAEGTDQMIARVANLPEHIRGTIADRRGVLVKAPKATQDRKTDLPVVGAKTVLNAASVGLAGIAVRAGEALVVDRAAVASSADELGFFVVGA